MLVDEENCMFGPHIIFIPFWRFKISGVELVVD
jgi:hypothetical protein